MKVKILKVDDNTGVNAAILERLEKVVQSLQENSVKMGQLLAVHDEKLTKQDRIDAVLFEKIEQVDLKLADEGYQRNTEERVNRIRQMFRSLREEAGPTMSVGAGGYTGAANASGPVAGYDPVLGKVDRRN